MSSAENVVKFYVLCNRLKDVVRSGWKVWRVKRERLESVAEHVYGVQMLAIAMWSEYGYEVDIQRVVMMLAVHELEEIGIGDLIPFEITPERKGEIGHEAVKKILSGLLRGDEIERLVEEFDERETMAAKFAAHCDKLEADLQCRLYDEEGDVDLGAQEGNALMEDERMKPYLEAERSWSGMWASYNYDKNGYEGGFAEVSKYLQGHRIS